MSAATLAGLVVIEAADMTTRRAVGDRVRDEGTAGLFAGVVSAAIGTTAASVVRPNRRPLPRSRWSFWIGTAVTWVGIGLNRWARWTLGSNYRPMVTIVEDQTVVTQGPYRFVRHPMYLGSIMICSGLGITLGTWPTALAWLLPPLALVRRIQVEERVLSQALGADYDAFASSRPRLLPGLW